MYLYTRARMLCKGKTAYEAQTLFEAQIDLKRKFVFLLLAHFHPLPLPPSPPSNVESTENKVNA